MRIHEAGDTGEPAAEPSASIVVPARSLHLALTAAIEDNLRVDAAKARTQARDRPMAAPAPGDAVTSD